MYMRLKLNEDIPLGNRGPLLTFIDHYVEVKSKFITLAEVKINFFYKNKKTFAYIS
jgi:hypothetical protein